jgi:acetoin utilization deacetylase AcuC-like enzyme
VELALPVAWSDRHALHHPDRELWIGLPSPSSEVPERAERIRAALTGAGARVVPARSHPDEALLAVHDPELLTHLREGWRVWDDAGLTRDPGQPFVTPYLVPHPELLAGEPLRVPAALSARAGRFSYDTMTLLGPSSWEAIRGAADAALTAADLVLEGEPVAYACCRPPGHHATRSAFGGSCYLNNAALAAAALRAAGEPVAVLDVDVHHGNGTQAIFRDVPAVLTGSVHVDPAAGWFPHFLGFAGEADPATNRNLPLAPGTGDEAWVAAVADLAAWAVAGGARALVVALGVDAGADDPEGPLRVTPAGFRAAGRILGGLGLPTVVVQEGGYRLDTIGELVLAALTGIERGRASVARSRRPPRARRWLGRPR